MGHPRRVHQIIKKEGARGREQDELIEEIAQRTDSSKGEAQKYVESFEEVVAGVLRGGEEIQITTGFGKFYVRELKAREGVNPQTKERMRIPAQKVPAFSAGQGLKTAL